MKSAFSSDGACFGDLSWAPIVGDSDVPRQETYFQVPRQHVALEAALDDAWQLMIYMVPCRLLTTF